jgi:glycerol-3-phosphate dehydrogenase (NAD(P)+)
MKITILGHGVFGSAVAVHLSNLGHEIEVDKINYSKLVFVCVPSFAVVSVLKNNKESIKDQKIIICSKGFSDDGRLLSDALKEEFPNNGIFFMYGPTIAEELKNGMISGIVLAGGNGKEEIKKAIESENLIVETTDDIVGVQVGASMKNVITIFVGIAEGAGYGQNTQAYIFTKGLRETQKLGVALGADPFTFIGLSCLGDLTLRSRNRLLGVGIGKGRKLEDIIAEMKYTQEGIATIKNSKIISKRIGLPLPFVDTLYSIIYENLSVEEGIRNII